MNIVTIFKEKNQLPKKICFGSSIISQLIYLVICQVEKRKMMVFEKRNLNRTLAGNIYIGKSIK